MPERPASRFPQNQPRRRPWLSGLAWQQVRQAPATICCLAAVWVAGLVTGSIAHGPPRWLSGHVGAGLPSLGHGYWWTPLSAGLWASGPGSYLAVTVLGLLILAPAGPRSPAPRLVLRERADRPLRRDRALSGRSAPIRPGRCSTPAIRHAP